MLLLLLPFTGDALFFHCNLLHTSSQNNSPNRRWALAIAYNRADNDPVKVHHHPKYTKLNKVKSSEWAQGAWVRRWMTGRVGVRVGVWGRWGEGNGGCVSRVDDPVQIHHHPRYTKLSKV